MIASSTIREPQTTTVWTAGASSVGKRNGSSSRVKEPEFSDVFHEKTNCIKDVIDQKWPSKCLTGKMKLEEMKEEFK